MEYRAVKRLVVVSNRVQPPSADGKGNQGGLAVALASALRATSGLWFGWSGGRADEFTGHINFERAAGVTTATIDLEDQDLDEYYNGYANRTLWPLFHMRIDLAEYERQFAGGYARVNARFADTLRPLLSDDDLIWVHDYHLIPLGRELRRRGVANRIGFFLHTPWPPTRLLLSLPRHHEVVGALLAYDLIGFHTEEWMTSFLYYIREQFPGIAITDDNVLIVGDRRVRVIVCPIGIDAADFVAKATSETAQCKIRSMRESAGGRKMIIGVDRLDYSKGLEERFRGFDRYLRAHPEASNDVFMLQIAPPSREDVGSYQEIRANLDALSGHINGEFATAERIPLRYVNRGYPRDELAGMFRFAKAALVTPLIDGMNLVAKEYVAAQDPDDPGVLILSRFAGAACQLKDALLVNPYSAEELADAIATALVMPLAERQRRWHALMDGIEREDVSWWLNRFVNALETPEGALPALT